MGKRLQRKVGLRDSRRKSLEAAASKKIYAQGVEELDKKLLAIRERERQFQADGRALFTDIINSLVDAQHKLSTAAESEAARKTKHRNLVKQTGELAFMRNGMAIAFAYAEMMDNPIIREFLSNRKYRRGTLKKLFVAKIMTLLYIDMYVMASIGRLRKFLGYDPPNIRSIMSSLYQSGYIESIDKMSKRHKLFVLTEKSMPVIAEMNKILANYANASRSVALLPVQTEEHVSRFKVEESKRDELQQKLDAFQERFREYNKVATDIIEELKEEDEPVADINGAPDIPAE